MSSNEVKIKILKIAYLWILLSVSEFTTAGLIDFDTSTLNDSIGVEWFDLSYTTNNSANNIFKNYGGFYGYGWKYANKGQVCELFGELGDDVGVCDIVILSWRSGSITPTNPITFNNYLEATYKKLLAGIIAQSTSEYGMGCYDGKSPVCVENDLLVLQGSNTKQSRSSDKDAFSSKWLLLIVIGSSLVAVPPYNIYKTKRDMKICNAFDLDYDIFLVFTKDEKAEVRKRYLDYFPHLYKG